MLLNWKGKSMLLFNISDFIFKEKEEISIISLSLYRIKSSGELFLCFVFFLVQLKGSHLINILDIWIRDGGNAGTWQTCDNWKGRSLGYIIAGYSILYEKLVNFGDYFMEWIQITKNFIWRFISSIYFYKNDSRKPFYNDISNIQ